MKQELQLDGDRYCVVPGYARKGDALAYLRAWETLEPKLRGLLYVAELSNGRYTAVISTSDYYKVLFVQRDGDK